MERKSNYLPYLSVVPLLLGMVVTATFLIPGLTTDVSHADSHQDWLLEASRERESDDSEWWLRSGGRVLLDGDGFSTVHGALESEDVMRVRYGRYSSEVTDNGYHPQNVFKLQSRDELENLQQELTATIDAVNLYNAENVHPWNGLSLISRRQDSQNYYFAEVRMDGKAVIKRAHDGSYTTLASEQVFEGEYDALERPNLLPIGAEFSINSTTVTQESGSVELAISLDIDSDGDVDEEVTAIDDGSAYDGTPITEAGTYGVYSDYMDVHATQYDVTEMETLAPQPDEEPADSEDEVPTDDEDTEKDQSEEPSEPEETPDEDLSDELSAYGFTEDVTIEETGSMSSSGNSDWWVNSGGRFFVENGIGHSILGSLPSDDRWREAYASANPTDTENGFKPQNILRLVAKGTWEDLQQEAYFNIDEYNTSDSPNRQGHNGFLFFNRYHDGDNLYYTGVRVDGRAVIKKKQNGSYYTLALEPVYSGSYNRSSNPNLIPENQWIGLRSVVTNNNDGSVTIEVYLDKSGDGDWQRVAKAIDDGTHGTPIREGAHAGIRGDFMDLKVRDYRIGSQ